jgi:hypothetical protein
MQEALGSIPCTEKKKKKKRNIYALCLISGFFPELLLVNQKTYLGTTYIPKGKKFQNIPRVSNTRLYIRTTTLTLWMRKRHGEVKCLAQGYPASTGRAGT